MITKAFCRENVDQFRGGSNPCCEVAKATRRTRIRMNRGPVVSALKQMPLDEESLEKLVRETIGLDCSLEMVIDIS